MSCLKNYFTGLMLFSVAAAYSIAPQEKIQEKHVMISGFTGVADEEPDHDWLTGTYCYCEFPKEMVSWAGDAHYYQIEYYNFELNTTFILTSTCPQDYKEDDVACVPKEGGKYELASPTIDHNICHTFPGQNINTDDDQHKSNEVCYKPHHHHKSDYLEFNNESRNIGKKGGQGPKWAKQKVANKVCTDLCYKKHHATLFRNPHHTPSHQVSWSGIDNMN